MPQELAKKIRAKYPGEYDDLDDITLERKVLAKYPEYEDLASEEAKKPASEPVKEKGVTSKVLDVATTPLSGDRFQRMQKERAEAMIPEREGLLKATGKGDFMDWLAWADATGRGAVKGIIEGTGAAVDQFTSPADLAALATGFGAFGAAARGAKTTAEVLRRATQGASLFPAGHGLKTVGESIKRGYEDPSSLTEFSFDNPLVSGAVGAAEAAGGAAGMYFPKSALAVKPKVTIPEVAPRTEVIPEAPITRVPEDAPARDLERMYENSRSLDELMNDPNYAQGAGDPELAGSVPYRAERTPEVQETQDIISQLFPEMATREPKRSLDLGIQEKPAHKPRPPITMEEVDAFLRDEDGSADYSKFFQGEEDLGYSVRTNDPDAVDLGDVSKPIDLEAEALRAGEETAKPVRSRVRNFLSDESGEFNPEFYNQPGRSEFSPDLQQVDDPAFGGTATRFEPRVPRPDTLGERIRGFLADESGGGDPSFMSRFGETMMDETGSVPRRPKEQANVWESLPDNVKDFFQERGVGPDDIAGQTLKEVSDQYDTALRIIAEQKAKRPPSKAKQAQLVKQSGERKAPLTEDEQIEQLTREAMAAAERERNSMLKSGAMELSPEELAGFRERMQAGEPLAPPLRSADYPQYAKPEEKTPRRLSRFSRFKNFMSDESGEVRFDSPDRSSPRLHRLMGEGDLAPDLPVKERTVPERIEQSLLSQIWDAPKGMMSVDAPYMTSAAFRQASPLVYTEPWFKAWKVAKDVYGSKKAFDMLNDSIKQDKNFRPRYKPTYDVQGNIKSYKEMPSVAEEIGVKMTDYDNITAREEHIGSRITDRIPWVRASNRSYAGFLNYVRKETLGSLLDQLDWSGGSADMTKAKEIANFINDASGRGSLKYGPVDLDRTADVLAKVLWSPRNLASKINILGKGASYAVRPSTYLNADNVARRAYVKGMIRSVGNWWVFAGLAALSGAKVVLDPTNSDFGKIRVGKKGYTRIDPGAGFQQLLVLMARMAPEFQVDLNPEIPGKTQFGKFTSSNKGITQGYGGAGPYDPSRGDVLGNFAASKMHPAAKLALDLFNADKKNPVHLNDRALQMALPMMTQDIIEAMKEDPSLAAAMAPLSSIGFGTSTYGQTKEFSPPVFTDSIEKALGLKKRSLAGTVR